MALWLVSTPVQAQLPVPVYDVAEPELASGNIAIGLAERDGQLYLFNKRSQFIFQKYSGDEITFTDYPEISELDLQLSNQSDVVSDPLRENSFFLTGSGSLVPVQFLYRIDIPLSTPISGSANVFLGISTPATGLAIDGERFLYFSFIGSGEPRVLKLPAPVFDEALVATGTTAADTLTTPRSLAFGPDGLLYVLDTGAARIVSFDTDLVYQSDFPLALDTTVSNSGLAIGPDGQLYVANDSGGGSVYDIYSGDYLGPYSSSVIFVTAARPSVLLSGDYLYQSDTRGLHVFYAPHATHFAVIAPSQVNAGSPFTVTVRALDAEEKVLTGFRGTVHFSSTDPSASKVLPADYTFVPGDQGVKQFTRGVKLRTLGEQTVGVTASGPISGSASTMVRAARETTTTLSATPSPAVFGQSVTLTAAVRVPAGGTATGQILFFDQGETILLGTRPLQSGQATFSSANLAVGTHPLVAVYEPTGSFAGSQGSKSLVIGKDATTAAVSTTGQNSSTRGKSVTFIATVSVQSPGKGTPTGSVAFHDDGILQATSPLTGGKATFSKTYTTPGTHLIRAKYLGSTNCNPSPLSAGYSVKIK